MKATGIVRRVDELGRYVIPKEFRKALGVKEGDPLECFATESGEIVLRKYENSELNKIDNLVEFVINSETISDDTTSKVVALLQEAKNLINFQPTK